jgi:hypothetical protein
MARIWQSSLGMTQSIDLRSVALLVGLSCSACNCEPNTIEPSTNTVDPSTHEPYQPKMPKATANPMTASDSVPEPPNDSDEADPTVGPP